MLTNEELEFVCDHKRLCDKRQMYLTEGNGRNRWDSSMVGTRRTKLSSTSIDKPTSEQCENKERVFENAHKVGYALWYPKMADALARAVAVFDKDWVEQENGSCIGGCVDVYVWHDGEFPFCGEGPESREPVLLHFCQPDMFIEFGVALTALNEHWKKRN